MIKLRLPTRSGHRLDVEFYDDGTMVANGGVEMTPEALKPKLTRFAWSLILCYRKDDAGVNAAADKLLKAY